jgi:hypothetical protein
MYSYHELIDADDKPFFREIRENELMYHDNIYTMKESCTLVVGNYLCDRVLHGVLTLEQVQPIFELWRISQLEIDWWNKQVEEREA